MTDFPPINSPEIEEFIPADDEDSTYVVCVWCWNPIRCDEGRWFGMIDMEHGAWKTCWHDQCFSQDPRVNSVSLGTARVLIAEEIVRLIWPFASGVTDPEGNHCAEALSKRRLLGEAIRILQQVGVHDS